MTQRREPIRSREYLDGSRGQECVFQIPDVCLGGTESTVACHLHDETFAMAKKADDTSTGDGCLACHDAMDGRSMVLSERDWLFYAFRALQRTIRRRIEQKILKLKIDPSRALADRPKAERKPREQRAKIPGGPMPQVTRPIPQRPDPWGKSRKTERAQP